MIQKFHDHIILSLVL